jgi:hypothetical protein
VSVAALFPSLQLMFARQRAEAELDPRALFELAGERIVACPPPTDVLAELVLPELCILRAAIRGDEKLVEVLQSTSPGERVAWLMGYEERLARIQRGAAERGDPFGPALRRELYDLSGDPHELHALTDTTPDRIAVLAAALARYAELCRAGGLEPAQSTPRSAEPESAVPDELRQIGYL